MTTKRGKSSFTRWGEIGGFRCAENRLVAKDNYGCAPVISASSLKKPRFRTLEIAQFTGTLWYPSSKPSPFMRKSKYPHETCSLTAAMKLFSGFSKSK